MIHRLLTRLSIVPHWYSLRNHTLHLLIILKTVCSQNVSKIGSKNFPKINDPTKSDGQTGIFFFSSGTAGSQNLKGPDESA